MTDTNDYDEAEDSAVDEDEAKAAERGASDSEEGGNLSDADLAEAESLTVTAKQKQRQALEDEIAAFLAKVEKLLKCLLTKKQDINPKHHFGDAFF
jgi:predicted  nucleic acid-binding Zn-ribbon protein